MLSVYEKLGKKMDREVVIQYIQHEKIAKDFANYLELYEKYQMDYQLEKVFGGVIEETLVKKAAHASFDERLSVVGLLISRCTEQFGKIFFQEQIVEKLFEVLKEAKESMLGLWKDQPVVLFADMVKQFELSWNQMRQAELLDREENRVYREVLNRLELYRKELDSEDETDGETTFGILKELFVKERENLELLQEKGGQMLEYAFDFMEAVFSNGQEMVIFITELGMNYYSVKFLQEYDCERYFLYNKNLLFEDSSRRIEARLREL